MSAECAAGFEGLCRRCRISLRHAGGSGTDYPPALSRRHAQARVRVGQTLRYRRQSPPAYGSVGTGVKTSNAQLFSLSSNVEGLGWPPVNAGPAAALAALMYQFEASQWLPHEILEK